MRSLHYNVTLLVVCWLWWPSYCEASLSDAFDEFFPQYNTGFQSILHQNCSNEYSHYLRDPGDDTATIPSFGSFGTIGSANVLVDCILESTPEIIKAKLGTSQIILGLAPSILASVGIRPQDSAILAVVGRKPLLSLFLALGSPAVINYRAAEYGAAIAELHEPGLALLRFKSRRMRYLLDTTVYLLAIAAAANVAELAWELADLVPFAAFPKQVYLPFLWAYLGTIIHVLASLALWFVIKRQPVVDGDESSASLPSSSLHTQGAHTKDAAHKTHSPKVTARMVFGEFTHHHRISVEQLDKSLRFYALSWLTSVFTACHIVFGTVLFASALFIGIDDSLIIIGRFLASAVLCRILLKVQIVLVQSQTDLK